MDQTRDSPKPMTSCEAQPIRSAGRRGMSRLAETLSIPASLKTALSMIFCLWQLPPAGLPLRLKHINSSDVVPIPLVSDTLYAPYEQSHY